MKNESTKDKLKRLAAEAPASNWKEQWAQNRKNRAWLKKSAQIAVKINQTLRQLGMTQKELAKQLAVSPQQVNKIVKGQENLTLETVCKLEAALGIELLTILKATERVTTASVKDFSTAATASMRKHYTLPRAALNAHAVFAGEEGPELATTMSIAS